MVRPIHLVVTLKISFSNTSWMYLSKHKQAKNGVFLHPPETTVVPAKGLAKP